MKHIKIFNEHQDYVNLNNNEISYCIDNEEIHYTNIHNNYIDHFICIDEMPMGYVEYSDAEGEHEEWSEDYYDYEVSKEDYILNYFLPLARNPYNDLGTNIYKYVGEYEYDSEKFYMWKHIKNNDYQIDDNILYILTYQKSFKGLTVRDDINNRFNPIFATLKYDKSITYLNGENKIKDKILFDEWEVNYSEEYLTIEALEGGEINFGISESADTDEFQSISYSLDNGDTWITTQNQDNKNDNIKITVNVNIGDKVLWKGNVTNYGALSTEGCYGWFEFSCRCNVYGNIMSLIYGDNFKNQTVLKGSFTFLFSDCGVVDASKLILPTLSLINYCYCGMFENCTSLIAAPELPAITLAYNCYNEMFSGCTSLTIAPELPATELAEECYNGMFKGCTSLTITPKLPATTLKEACYCFMFYGCTSLTIALELPAITLISGCYQFMFYGCTSLNYIKAMFTTTPGTDYTENWVNEVAPKGIFVKHNQANWNVIGNNGIPINWSIIINSNNSANNSNNEFYENNPNFDHYIVLDRMYGRYIIDPSLPKAWDEDAREYDVSKEDYIINFYLFLDRSEYFADKLYKFCGEYLYNSTRYYIWENISYNYYHNEDIKYILTTQKSFKGLTVKDNINNRYKPNYLTLNTDHELYKNTINTLIDNRRIVWDEWYEPNNYDKQYLTIEALDDGAISFVLNGQSTEAITSISYSKDNGLTWETIINEEESKIINVNVYKDDKVLWKGNATTMSEDDNPAGFFSNIPVNVYGNIMSMLYGDNFVDKYSFPSNDTSFYTFFGCEKELYYGGKNDLYVYGMNTGLNIINAKNLILPATSLTRGCYSRMFEYCTSLVNAPKLPATIFTENCYKYMFWGCTSLIKAPTLKITSLASNCFYHMFEGCNKLRYMEIVNKSGTLLFDNNYTYTEAWVKLNVNSRGIILCVGRISNLNDEQIPRNENTILSKWKILRV